MKAVLFAMFVSVVGFAQVDSSATMRLNCVVPIEGKAPVITVAIEATEEAQADFLSLVFTEPAKELIYYNQLEKGAVKEGIAQGQLVTLVISESVKMDNGAIRGAGLLVLSKSETGFEGFATLNDTFYPLTCN